MAEENNTYQEKSHFTSSQKKMAKKRIREKVTIFFIDFFFHLLVCIYSACAGKVYKYS